MAVPALTLPDEWPIMSAAEGTSAEGEASCSAEDYPMQTKAAV